jgi:6-pyruvoyltetrahydropterin/6-carboxytetrahydropterin synthase
MIIRKLFKFENAHIVRGCSSLRCSKSLHGHSYRVEILIKSNFLDNGQMVYDFGLMKSYIKDFIDSFDHSISFWDGDDSEYIKFLKKFSQRWISLPISPSAEQLSRVFYLIIDRLLSQTDMSNGEREVSLESVIVHETDSGYAQCFKEDAYNHKNMGLIELKKIIFSNQISSEWGDSDSWKRLINGAIFKNPKEC